MMQRSVNILPAVLLAALIPVSCEKEIFFDYKSIEPKTVIEASVTQEGAAAKISRTINMNAALDGSNYHTDAEITLSGSDGSSANLTAGEDGTFSADFEGKSGVTYTLTVRTGGKVYTSTSTMPGSHEVTDSGFYMSKVLGVGMFTYDVDVKALPSDAQEQFFFYRMFKGDKVQSWGISDNRFITQRGTVLLSMPCSIKMEGMDDLGEDAGDIILLPGDEVTVEAYAIDKKTHAYLRSDQMTSRSRANTLPDFSDGALGYFSARVLLHRATVIFDPDNIEEKEYGY